MSPPSLGLIETSNRNGLPPSRPPSLHDSTKNMMCGDISDAFFNDMMVVPFCISVLYLKSHSITTETKIQPSVHHFSFAKEIGKIQKE